MGNRADLEEVMTIKEAIGKYFFNSQATGKFSSASLINRRYELNRFQRFCRTHKVTDVADIHKDLIVRSLDHLNITNGSKKTVLQTLMTFMDFLVTEGLVLENIAGTIASPRVKRHDPDFLTVAELEQLFQAEASGAPPKCVDRNLLLLSLFSILLIRASEAINLKMEDVRLDMPEIWIRRKGGRVAKIPMNDYVVEKFLNWYAVRETFKGYEKPWVFLSTHGKQLTPRQARHLVRKALERAEIVKRQRGTHLLRHSGASLLSEKGEDPRKIQYLLGHRSLATTSRYLHFDRQALKEMVERSPRFAT